MKEMTWFAIGLAVVLVLAVAGAALAQTVTPPIAPKAAQGAVPALKGLGVPGWGWKAFDAAATALKLSPSEFFDRLHSGQTVAQIAQAQGVELKTVQDAVRAVQQNNVHQALAKAVADGRMTQAQADWLQQGVDNNWLSGAVATFLRARLR